MMLLRSLPSMSVARFSALAVLLLAAAACDTGEGTTLYDPTNTGGAAPTIGSISPSGVVLAGVDEIVITGTNFSPTLAENLVYFDDGAGNSAQGTVLEASSTTLRVKAPNLPNANLRLRVAVRGAANFSNAVPFPLVPAFVDFGSLATGTREEVFGIASDGSGGIFASLQALGAPVGVKRFAQDGSRTDYFASTATWFGLARASDGLVYGGRRNRGVFRLPEGGAQQTLAAFPTGASISAVAEGAGDFVWTAGSNTNAANASIYRVPLTGTFTAFPFVENVRDLVATQSTLYAVTATAIWSFPIDAANDLGAGSVFYDVSAELGATVEAFAAEVSADGTLFVGTNADDPLIEVSPSGAGRPLYPGVLTGPISGLAWGTGSRLYMATASVPPPSAEEPGRDAGLFLVETRRPAR